MVVSVRTLDDGAWISVNDSRAVGVSQIWPIARHGFCECEVAHLLLEAFYDVGVDEHRIVAGVVGQCIDCGTEGSIDTLPVGRIIDGDFYAYDSGQVQSLLEPVEDPIAGEHRLSGRY
ncbi:hypothetical protein [Natranaeroarchaeum aerophilus]|uniref:DUF8134 domain-containing protein n=1 Tax=Natranaeroarchaeum aerophilus TaxID=2917711 RepID=A0AAE3FQA6_9EURY|nr:hypothetical protein [Natranaeroarchaeum aerophilus]MCL9813602.1 hypothetical protein [Natranaeroarchaeum aerophilus]